MPRKAKEEIDELKEKNVKKEPNTKKVATKKSSNKEVVSSSKSKKVATKKAPSKKSKKLEDKEIESNSTSKATKKTSVKKATLDSKEKNTTKEKSTTKNATNKDKSSEQKVAKNSKNSKGTPKKPTAKKTTSDKTTKKVVAKTKKPKATSNKRKSSEPKSKEKNTKTKTSSTKKSVTSKKETVKRKTLKKKVEIVEYYDLPYRYNQTVVKVLAQTPSTLFVYWDISDDDRKKYIKQYGEYFFHNTKPVLIVHNKTKNYNFEVDINDFANSWYLRLVDSDCDYQIELGRRPINTYVDIPNNYLYITNSNEIESPNDHILFDKLSHFVYFKNVKTNETIKKHTNLTLLNKIGKISSIQEFYKKLYPDEAINFDRLDLKNPSSNNPTSSFK